MKSYIIRLIISLFVFISSWVIIIHFFVNQPRGVSTPINDDEQVATNCCRRKTSTYVSNSTEGDGLTTFKATGAMEAMRWYNNQRAFPTGRIPSDWLEKAKEHIQKNNLLKFSSVRPFSWTSIGPDNISGRVRSIAVDPSNPNIVYCGSVSGGIWKSTNGGSAWVSLTDFASSLVIGCITIDPTNSNTIYAGTGEGYFNVDALRGIGILKSTDAGATWNVLNNFDDSRDPYKYYFINKIVIRSDNPSILFAALTASKTDEGIWKSTDAGVRWFKVGILPKTSSKRCVDLVMDPTNANIMYAAFGLHQSFDPLQTDGVYKTIDGGDTWIKKTTGFPSPTTRYDRISLAIAPSNSNVIYACLSDSNYNTHSIQKSANGGNSWFAVGTPYDASISKTHLGGQGWYNNVIKVHPIDPNIVYTGGINLFKSTNGGSGWFRIGTNVHVDHHAIMFDPLNSSIMYSGNDGGIWKSSDGGSSFSDMNAGFRTVQFYSGAVHPTQAIYYGGTQDNGTLRTIAQPYWTQVFPGDGGATAVDYNTPTIVYTEYVNLAFQKSTNSGADWSPKMNGIASESDPYKGTTDRCLFIAPFVIDPTNPKILVAGTYRVYRTTNGADLWVPISSDLTGDGPVSIGYQGSCISAVAISKSSSSTIYVGTSGSERSTSLICVTNNGTSSSALWDTISKPLLPNRYVKAIVVNPNNPDSVLVGYSGYNTQTPSTPGHIFLSPDQGGTWLNMSGDLPDIPVNAIVLDRLYPGHIIVGTDLGVYETINGGVNWVQQNNGLANVSIADLDLNWDGYLYAATHGRGMFKSDSVFRLSTDPTVVGTASPSEVSLGDSTLLSAAVTPGINPTSTGMSVSGDLSLIGGLESQPFFDDGSHGDITNGDNIFSFKAKIAPSTIPGSKNLVIYVTDAQTRGSDTTIILSVIPKIFTLNPNYPNPFNAGTTISFMTGQNSLITLKIYNFLGQEIMIFFDNKYYNGVEEVKIKFDGSNIPSGIYFYRIIAEEVEGNKLLFSQSKKMVLVR